MMEVSKFKAIAARVKSGELDRAYYINFIGTDTAYIFSIRDIARGYKKGIVTLTSQTTPVTTAADNGKTDKRVFYIPKSLGLKLTKIEDKWIKQ